MPTIFLRIRLYEYEYDYEREVVLVTLNVQDIGSIKIVIIK